MAFFFQVLLIDTDCIDPKQRRRFCVSDALERSIEFGGYVQVCIRRCFSDGMWEDWSYPGIR